MEIERKYLIASIPEDLNDYPHVEIEQGYLCTSPTLRIRRMGDAYILTVKERRQEATTAIVNREEEFLLSQQSFLSLRDKCEGRLVCKTRYRVPLGDGHVAEVDIFHGSHEGLRIVEVEFASTEEADRFVPPAWFGDEVSDDPRYRNSYMAIHG